MQLQRIQYLILDAPTVAVVWSAAISYKLSGGIRWESLIVLWGATFLVYLSDRLQDVIGRPDIARLSERHAFVRRHTGLFEIVLSGAFVITVIFAFWKLTHAELLRGSYVLGGVVLYFIGLKVISESKLRILWKRMGVACLFSGGVLALSLVPEGQVLLWWLWFSGLVLLNLIGVQFVECRSRSSKAWTYGIFLVILMGLVFYSWRFLPDSHLARWIPMLYTLTSWWVARLSFSMSLKVLLMDLAFGFFAGGFFLWPAG